MKKIKLFLVLLFMLFLTGCSNHEMVMEINKDKSMNLVITILSDYDNGDIINNVPAFKEKFEQHGFSVDEYKESNKYGMIIKKYYDNIDDISNGLRKDEFDLLYFYNNDYSSDIESKIFNVDKGIDTNRYAANFYVDLSSLNIDLNKISVVFKVVVPSGTVSNNANFVSDDGNQLTWNVTSLGKTEIDFVFELKSYDYIYYGAGVLIIIFLVFSIFSNLFSRGDDDEHHVKYNKDINDLDRRIDNFTKNSIKKSNNNSVNMDKLLHDKANEQIHNRTIKIDNVKIKEKSSVNTTKNDNNINNSIDDITSFRTPQATKKKGLMGKLNKKGKSSNSNNPVNLDTGMKLNENAENFNNTNMNLANNITSKNSESGINFNIDVPVIGGGVNNNFERTSMVDIDNVSNLNSSLDTFENNDDIEEEKNGTSVIRVNSKDVVLDNKEKENL